jgi:rhodanese-related sulfurtransferase
MKVLIRFVLYFFTFAVSVVSLYSQTYNDLSTQQSYDLWLAEKSNPNFIIIDIRTANEYTAGHLENALSIDFYQSDAFYDFISKLDKSKKYLLYCASSNRSGQAINEFKKRNYNFSDMNEMDGGFNSWKAKGYPYLTGAPTSVDESKLFASNFTISTTSNNTIVVSNSISTQLRIFNAIGNQVFEKDMLSGTHILNIENLPKGLYIVKARDAVKMNVKKIIVD